MYKKQMRFQKFICYALLITGALVFLYSLGLLTDLYDNLYSMMPYPDDPSQDKVAGVRIYYDMQDFNRSLTKASLVMILLAVFNMIMNTHTRRRYYVGNYIAIAALSICNIVTSVWAMSNVAMYKERYLTEVDFDSLIKRLTAKKQTFVDSTFWFDVSKPLFIIVIIATVLFIANLIWKIIVTKQEKKLILEGKEAA